jgi:hypothetical protein
MASKGRRIGALNAATPPPPRESMQIVSNPVYYYSDGGGHKQKGCCAECIGQTKECAAECFEQTRQCLSEMTLCQACITGCIIPPLCTPLLAAWCWYRGNGVR